MSPARPDEYQAAFECLYPSDPGKAAMGLAFVRAGEFGTNPLIVAREGARIIGTILVHLLPGSPSATVFPPGALDRTTADALARKAVERLVEAGVKQAQTFLRPADAARAEPLLRAGFRHMAYFSMQIRTLELLKVIEPPTKAIWFAPATAQTPGFATTLEATYEGTLDCPELNDLLEIQDVLKSYQHFPKGEAPGWFLVMEARKPIGVVLLGPGTRAGIVQLSYLGLVPSARGRGRGRDLLRFALREAASRFAECLVVSVDERNSPALQLYVNEHFREYDRQEIYLWSGRRDVSGD